MTAYPAPGPPATCRWCGHGVDPQQVAHDECLTAALQAMPAAPTPYQRRARYRRGDRRSRRVARCTEVVDGFRCRSRPAAGARLCLLHGGPS